MAASNYIWIASFLISVMISNVGVFGRAVNSLGSLSQLSKTEDEPSEPPLRMDVLRHREQCAELTAPWLENTQKAPGNDATLLKLHVRPLTSGAPRGLVFPGKSLFSFIRRVYRCCQEGVNCWSVKGIQGRLREDADVEFVLSREILSLAVMRAELHLKVSNPQHLDIHPIIPFMAKHNLPTRYRLRLVGDTVELRVDLLFLFQSQHEVAGGAGRGPSLINIRLPTLFPNEDLPGEKSSLGALQDTNSDVWGEGLTHTLPVMDLGLILGCSRDGSDVPCETGGSRLSHTPFMALYFRRN
ncbi:uncharacterized protein PAE49_006763 [Odontesthes bonariensis]|uniref:uncharacterized protein LOC142382967 n=1 Tax=Odontesthes bonariensis TaxID=219752 RepID=UPI003F587E40